MANPGPKPSDLDPARRGRQSHTELEGRDAGPANGSPLGGGAGAGTGGTVEYIDHHRHPSGKADDEIHTLRDITNARDLIRYAVQVQLHLIGRTAADIASRNPRDHQGLSRCLAGDEE